MKSIISPSLLLAIIAALLLFSGCQPTNQEQMRHIVVFKYKPTATPEQIEQVTQAFGELQDKIPGIVAFEHGVNDSPENKNLGFTHVYQMTFEDAAARDNYLPHPEHKKFGELLGQLDILEDAFVVDYVPVGE
jgi:phosphate/sulfate permease